MATLTSQLEAVNTMLGYIGEAPVNSISNTSELPVSAANAVSILDEVSREVQSEGWHFNTEDHCHKTADANGYLLFDTNALRMDFSNPQDKIHDVVRRNGRLYDKVNHTDVWKVGEEYTLDIVWLFTYTDLLYTNI